MIERDYEIKPADQFYRPEYPTFVVIKTDRNADNDAIPNITLAPSRVMANKAFNKLVIDYITSNAPEVITKFSNECGFESGCWLNSIKNYDDMRRTHNIGSFMNWLRKYARMSDENKPLSEYDMTDYTFSHKNIMIRICCDNEFYNIQYRSED